MRSQKPKLGGGVINPLFEEYLKSLQNATPDERKAILSLIEGLLNETLHGDVVVSDYLRIKNVRWNGTDLIFQIWWYNGTEPALIKTYLWHDPISALDAVKESKSSAYSVQSLENQFVIKPLSVSPGVRIVGVDYLTNDGSGEYVYIENPSITTVSLKGWYLLDDYAYSNQKCWVNNNLPRDECHDSFGRNHIFKLSMSLAPHTVREVPLASSPSNAILNNDGDTLYLIDRWGNLVSMYHYAASPNITIEDVLIYPASPVNGDNLRLRVRLDNRGSLDGTGKIEVYIDGTLVATRSGVKIRRYSIATYTIKNVWNAKAGTHSLIVKFVPEYNGNTQTFGMIFKVSEVHPRIRDVHYENAIESHPLRFSVTAENPSGSKVNVKLTLFIDGTMEYGFNKGFLYGHSGYGFYLIWKRPEAGYHTVTILMQSSDGSTSKWEKRIYVKPNSPPSIVDLELPSMVYAGENSNGSVLVADGDGDKVTVKVNILGHYGFRLRDIAPGKVRKFPLAPIYNRTNCREEVTVEATPVDEYGRKGKPVTRTITVITDSDKDGWCNALELEYGTNPRNNDTDGDGVIDSKDVDPLRDAIVELYIFRARALDPAENYNLGWNVDFRVEATFKAGSIIQTLKEDLPSDTQDVEKMTMLGKDIFENIQREAVAVLRFNPPDDVESIEVDLKLVDRDMVSGDDIMDISPKQGNNEAGKVAKLFFSLRNGTWWGDDYINDHKDYFGYGHLSGADDSTEDYTNGGEHDAEPFSKYYDELEALGYDLSVVNITDVKGWDGIESLELKDYQSGTLYRYTNPEEAVLFTLSLPDGTQRRVLIINKRNAKVMTMKLNDEVSATYPGRVDKDANMSNLTSNATPKVKNEAKYEATLIFRRGGDSAKTLSTESVSSSETSTETSALTFDAVATSTDVDEDDAEIWFLIKTNDDDGDGIPFHRELELNKELGTNRFSPSINDAYGDYDGDGVPNSVELFIGKNPVKPDVLGIKLSVAVGWNADEDYLKKLIKGFQRASQVIYDYTDGYAMITEISIKNNVQEGSEEWEESMVRIRPTKNSTLLTYNGFWYWKWVKNIDGKENGYILLFREFGDKTPDKYYRGIAHELGHFVFGIGDEYSAPFSWDHDKNGTLEGFCYWDLASVLQNEYHVSGFDWLHTVMGRNWKGEELSTKGHPTLKSDYDWFYNELVEYDKKLREKVGYGLAKVINDHDPTKNITNLYQIMPTHWQTTYTIDWMPHNMTSGWEVVFALLAAGHTMGYHGVSNIDAGLYLDLDFDGVADYKLPDSYIPKVGPYTGVGYYLRVNWG